jgi:hypothetical protein
MIKEILAFAFFPAAVLLIVISPAAQRPRPADIPSSIPAIQPTPIIDVDGLSKATVIEVPQKTFDGQYLKLTVVEHKSLWVQKGVPDSYVSWAFGEVQGFYFPSERPRPFANDKYEATVDLGTEYRGIVNLQVRSVVALLGPPAQAKVNAYLSQSKRSGFWGLPDGALVITDEEAAPKP